MRILGIETSCDETGVCIIEAKNDENEFTVLGNQLYSQIAKHQEFGGVFPMLAKREHAKNLVPLFKKCLEEANLILDQDKKKTPVNDNPSPISIEEIKNILSREPELFTELEIFLKTVQKPEIDAIAVTNGPGLEPALWVGVCFAKALSTAWNIPLIPTNHLEGHILVASLKKEEDKKSIPLPQQSVYKLLPMNYPSIALLISGGHTQLVLIKSKLDYEIIGNTFDDALGEAYDKVARMLGLPYPGGKIISELAEKEKKEKPAKQTSYPLPRPMIRSQDLNFSFSGLKTAVLYTLKKIPEITPSIQQEIALEFENAVSDVLINKVSQAIEKFNPTTLIVGGGVSANKRIREELEKVCKKYSLEFLVPEISTSTDNALMIALAGMIRYQNLGTKCQQENFKAEGNLSL